MQITRNELGTMPGPGDWFTGAVFVDALGSPSGPSRLNASSVHFTKVWPDIRERWDELYKEPGYEM